MDQTTITASAAELQAITDLLTRAPMSLSERLFVDALITRWHTQSARAPMLQETTGTLATPEAAPSGPPATPANETGAPVS